ncbi:MAG: AfsR/SARP family transcriptional regulator [Kribbellaceae bacterium]
MEERLARGDRTVVVDAVAAAAASPLRERTALLHVRALASDGRTAEAMAVAQTFRRRLVEETGLDPTPALAELEQLVAAGDLERPHTVITRQVAKPDAPMVGRQHDREEVMRLLRANSMVTITGPGGVGRPGWRSTSRPTPSTAPMWCSSSSRPSTDQNGSARPPPRRSVCGPPARCSRPTWRQHCRTAGCCSCSTTASMWSTRAVTWCPPSVATRRMCTCSRRRAPSCMCRASTSYGYSRCRYPGTAPTWTRCRGSPASGRSSSTPNAASRTTSWLRRTRLIWSRCCAGSTGCRSASSSPPARSL